MKSLLQVSNENQKKEFKALPDCALIEIAGGHPGGAEVHFPTYCPDGTVHIDDIY